MRNINLQRLLSPLVVLTLFVAAGGLRAQSDSVAREVGGPVFDSTAIAVPEDDVYEYYAPDSLRSGRRNAIYYFGHDFSTIFVEASLLNGPKDLAFGLIGAYVPEVWGGYLSGHVGWYYDWVAGGVEYRLSSPWNKTDWHLFGGATAGFGTQGRDIADVVGGELGVRVAANATFNGGKFACLSGSVALRATTDGGFYVVGGISIGLGAASGMAVVVL